MIENEKCIICGVDLELEEVDSDIGLCACHKKEYESNNYLTLSCFNCCDIISIYHKRSIVKGAVIKDDHLFCEKCPKCSKGVEYSSLSYLTIDNLPARNALYVNKLGKISLSPVLTNSPC